MEPEDRNATYNSYFPVPGGNSSIRENDPRDASSDLSPARLLQNRRFNHALVSLLDLLRQLVEFGRIPGSLIECPDILSLRILGVLGTVRRGGEMLFDIPIMGLGSSSTSDRDANRDSKRENDASGEEQWTRACRAVLAVLKRILVVESEADRTMVQYTSAQMLTK
jgi:beclin 1